MSNWDPPQVGDTPKIPITPAATTQSWWKRRYGRLPVWGWATGGAVGLLALSAVVAPDGDGQLASVEIDATSNATESASAAAQTAPPTTATPAAVVERTTVITTTDPPATAAPQVMIVVTLPVTTTTAPPTTTPPTTTTTTDPPPPPTTTTVAVLPLIPQSDCDPNYTGCVPIDSDVDCAGGSGNGPSYVRGPVTVIGSDIYDLDRDGDGVGCE